MFQYNHTQVFQNQTHQIYNLTSREQPGVLKDLVAQLTLLDDDGTIVFNMTTAEDYHSGNTQKFRAPHVQNYANFNNTNLKRSLDDFCLVDIPQDYFGFTIFAENHSWLHRFNSQKMFMSEYLVFDSSTFPGNPANEFPLMGMGERAGDLFYQNQTAGIFSRWSHDAANPIDDGYPPGRNMYGFQPFYTYQAPSGRWVGVFNNNPYATDYIVTTPTAAAPGEITTVMIGGAIERYFFQGDKPDDVIIKYEKLTGMPTMPPLWAFGWQ